MKRWAQVLLVLLVAFFGFGGVSTGQDDGPAIEIDPETVEEVGTYDVTVTGSGFSIDAFVLSCPGAGGSVEALEEGDPTTLCDLSDLITATPDADGGWEVTLEDVEVDDCGMVFVAGDVAQTEVGGPVLLEVENPAADVVCEVSEDTGYDLAAALAEAEDAEAAGDDLADTGTEAITLVVIGLTTLLAGAYIAVQARRLSVTRR